MLSTVRGMGGVFEKCGCSSAKNDDASRISPSSISTKAKVVSEADTELLEKVKQQLNKKFKSRKEAFEKLGGVSGATINKKQFIDFMKDIGFDGPAEKAFNVLDEDCSGFITKAEFKARLCADDDTRRTSARKASEMEDTGRRQSDRSNKPSVSIAVDEAPALAELAKLRHFLQTKFKNPKEAFADLDKDGDNTIKSQELAYFLKNKLQYPGDAKAVFHEMDKDGDGNVTWTEFRERLIETKIQLKRAKSSVIDEPDGTGDEKRTKLKKSKSTVGDQKVLGELNDQKEKKNQKSTVQKKQIHGWRSCLTSL